jgi:pSer/pThr/pTyr-binding forkhead associated (FHA) protein
VIERAPKRLAMLVDKSRPDVKFDLTTATANVGRAQGNQIVLTDATVSRHHAWIKWEDDGFFVFDVGSANKTYVNEEVVTDPRRLEDGDIVRFGDAAFIFKRVF